MFKFEFNYLVLFVATFSTHNIWKVHALQCYVCNSTEKNQEACIDNPAKLKNVVHDCDESDNCITAIMDRATLRNCKTKILPSGSCPGNDKILCKTCNSPLCNKEIFPADRRLCYQCNGSSCHNITKARIKPTYCRFYEKDDQCYSYGMSIGIGVKGCISERKKCEEPKCIKCNKNGCNDVLTLKEHLCYSCSYMKSISSLNDPSCKRAQFHLEKCAVSGLKTCSNKVLPGDSTTCFTWYNHNTDVVTRGCSQTKGHLVNGELRECKGDLCNNECVNIKCLQCDSKKDYKCISSTTYMQAKTCPAGTTSCFSCESKKGHVVRGCGAGNLKQYHCIPCYGHDGCNKQAPRTCYRCSSGFNSNCASWVNPTSIALETCNSPQDDCVTTVKENSYIARGCQETVAECTKSNPFCIRCQGSLCNEGILTFGRLSCYQCRNSEECNRGLIKPTSCINYYANDFCYAYITHDGEMIRGCYSDGSFNNCRKLENGSCKVCFENECNNWPLQQQPTLKCVQCSRGNETCAWAQINTPLISCTSPVPYNIDESCFIYKHQDGHVSRGCTLDHPEIIAESWDIKLCYNSGCNFKNVAIQTCVQCITKDTNSSCAVNATNITPTECECVSKVQTFERRGCYMKELAGDVIVRGCSCNLHTEQFNECKAGNNSCIHCIEQACNAEELWSDSGEVFKFSISLMVFSTIIITLNVLKN